MCLHWGFNPELYSRSRPVQACTDRNDGIHSHVMFSVRISSIDLIYHTHQSAICKTFTLQRHFHSPAACENMAAWLMKYSMLTHVRNYGNFL